MRRLTHEDVVAAETETHNESLETCKQGWSTPKQLATMINKKQNTHKPKSAQVLYQWEQHFVLIKHDLTNKHMETL